MAVSMPRERSNSAPMKKKPADLTAVRSFPEESAVKPSRLANLRKILKSSVPSKKADGGF